MVQLSKEAIRENAFKMSGSMGTDTLDYVWPEIEQMVNQEKRIEAMEFIKWLFENNYVSYDNGLLWHKIGHATGTTKKTLEQLYKQKNGEV